ncbi:MAG: murein biosynthesis integral membrane protein MurJ [Pseudonocardia sp.]|nr:murein biosynthesis integral membrane protein MurJ [Pseudonocardia sp.]
MPPPTSDEITQIFAPITDAEPVPSLGRSSSLIAIASLVSRVTGVLRQIVRVSVRGLGLVNSSYTIANTLPNIIYELLIGGVLSSVLIPLLVRAQTEDADGGDTYTRRLLTLAGSALLLATLAAMAAAPLITSIYVSSAADAAAAPLTTAFAYLLLPQIFFYGLGALLGAVLNSRGVFGPFAWAPVLNNVVVLLVLGVFVLMPGEISIDPVRMGEPKLLVLGIGTTLGIVVQAAVLIPAIRRIGFRYRPTWGWDRRLTQTGGLALWVVGYVLIGQIGLVVTTNVAIGATAGGPAIYTNTWLLLQVPYGILGVSMLTVLMPRMSRAAAEGRTEDVVADLTLGSRLSAVFLVPISALITVFGTSIALALFAWDADNIPGVRVLGAALTVSAFGLLPYAITMLQLRVFYALADSRTPTMVQLFTVGLKIPMLLLAGLLLPPEQVVLGLAAANSASFVCGAILGQVLLRRRLGRLPTLEVLGTIASTTVAALLGVFVAFGVVTLLPVPDSWSAPAQAWTRLVVAFVVAGPAILAAMRLLKVREVDVVVNRITRLAGRLVPRRGSGA